MADIIVEPYYPAGVKHIITTGSQHYIGLVDETTILKYPHFPGESSSLRIEGQIFQRLGRHPRIIEFKGNHADGLLLEYAPNGTLETHLHKAQPSIPARLSFARQIAEGVAYAHQQNVLICDIHVRNVLLDANFGVKLCDFQGRLLNSDGEVIVDGGASENAESFMPRASIDHADKKTDIFALGSTIYFVMTGHRPFPEYHTIRDEAKFEELYRKGEFPSLDKQRCGEVIRCCWEGKYEDSDSVVKDLRALGNL